jgi:uncharacterized membrane protein YccC
VSTPEDTALTLAQTTLRTQGAQAREAELEEALQRQRIIVAILRHREALIRAWSSQLALGPVQDGTQLVEGLRAILDGSRDHELKLLDGEESL